MSAGRALNSLANMDRSSSSGGSVQPMVVRVVVPTRKAANSEGLMIDAAVLLDPDASADEVLHIYIYIYIYINVPGWCMCVTPSKGLLAASRADFA